MGGSMELKCLVIESDIYNESGKYIGDGRDLLIDNGDFIWSYF